MEVVGAVLAVWGRSTRFRFSRSAMAVFAELRDRPTRAQHRCSAVLPGRPGQWSHQAPGSRSASATAPGCCAGT